MTHEIDERTTIDAREARQAERGYPVLLILAAGLFLAVAVWAGTEWYGEAIDSPQATSAQVTSDLPQS